MSGSVDKDERSMGDFEVSGTVTTGVILFHSGCGEWFAEWSSLENYPSVQALLDACRSHECPEVAEGAPS